jgi:hypothetical protein
MRGDVDRGGLGLAMTVLVRDDAEPLATNGLVEPDGLAILEHDVEGHRQAVLTSEGVSREHGNLPMPCCRCWGSTKETDADREPAEVPPCGTLPDHRGIVGVTGPRKGTCVRLADPRAAQSRRRASWRGEPTGAVRNSLDGVAVLGVDAHEHLRQFREVAGVAGRISSKVHQSSTGMV